MSRHGKRKYLPGSLVEANVKGSQRQAALEVGEVSDGVEAEPKDAEAGQLVGADVLRLLYVVVVEMKFH